MSRKINIYGCDLRNTQNVRIIQCCLFALSQCVLLLTMFFSCTMSAVDPEDQLTRVNPTIVVTNKDVRQTGSRKYYRHTKPISNEKWLFDRERPQFDLRWLQLRVASHTLVVTIIKSLRPSLPSHEDPISSFGN